MIIDCHGHYTTAPAQLEAWRKRQIAALDDPSKAPTARGARDRRRRDPRVARRRAAAHAARARHGPHHLLAAGELHGPPHRHGGHQPRVGGDLQRPRAPGLPALSGQLHRGLPASAVARGPAGELHPRARAVREDAGLRRLQPQSGPLGRALARAAAHRPLVVPAVRADGRARRAGDGARQHLVQSVLPRDRRALHQRGHDGVHAVPHLGPVPRLSHAAVHHPARRRGGSVPLGPLQGHRAGPEAPAAARSCC